MKLFKNIAGIFASILFLLAFMVFPQETHAVAAASLGDGFADFVFSTGGTTLAAVTAFGNLKRLDRQVSNLGGGIKLFFVDETQFTADWPTEAQVSTGEIVVDPPLAAEKNFANLVFDLNTCSFKSTKSGDLGYQQYDQEFEAEFAGITAAQRAALNKQLNLGAVAIIQTQDGVRHVVGASYAPLTLTDDFNSGAKTSDKKKITLKGKTERGLAFGVTRLGADVEVPILAL